MEYIRGDTLKSIIRDKKRLSLKMTLHIALRICNALEHAHINGIIHRDIKSQNILIGRNGAVKVADFGIAKAATGDTVTFSRSTVLGSVHYFSPEQARGDAATAQSDIYALGIVLYEMATGSLPFQGANPVTVALKHINEMPPLPADIYPNVNKGLEDIIMRCIAKDPRDRYANANELARDVRMLMIDNGARFTQARPKAAAVNALTTPSSSTVVQRKAPAHRKRERTTVTYQGRAAPEEEEDTPRNPVFPTIARIALLTFIFLCLLVTLFIIWNSVSNRNSSKLTVIVPDLSGMTSEEAQLTVRTKLNLRYVPKYENDDTVPENIVISQSPAANTPMKEGQEMIVTISQGPVPILVPNLLNTTQEEAERMLSEYGLRIGQIIKVPSQGADKPEGFIFQQQPAANMVVARDEPITIWIYTK